MRQRGHILLVEDNEATRYAVSRILANAGYLVTPAADGETALSVVGSARPDLVLLDVKLPDVSGFDVVRRLKSDPATSAIPVVHLSATSVSSAEQVRGLEGGADAYLTHPIEARVLVATLDAFLRARRAESRYRKIFETGLLGIVSWDASGRIVDANDTFLRLVGRGRAEIVDGRLRWEVLVPEGGPAAAPLPPGGIPQEMTLVRGDGARVPALVGRAQNVDGEDEVAFVLDITDRKRAEEALRAADRRKDEFLAILSHELRNPLAPIRNAIALLARRPPQEPPAVRALEILDRQTRHLTRVVDDLLDVTRIASGKVKLQRASVDLGEVVQKTAEDVRSMFEDAGVDLRVAPVPVPIWIDADVTRISQVVWNLLQNAAKFTPSGGHVSVSVVAARDGAEVRVRDDGIGITREELAEVFQPFAQADRSLARTKGGLGLGLALVRGLIELHGGSVRVSSEGIDRGSEFTVVLPLVAAPAAAAGGSVDATRRTRVLVIEDNVDAAESLADLLRLVGHEVWTAHDGASGIARAVEVRPDVILCDIGLPDVDGYAVARAIRGDARLAGARLVALTGYARDEDRERAAAAGFDQHVAKPPRIEVLQGIFAGLG
jgi:PAS domain S-box-containing protein